MNEAPREARTEEIVQVGVAACFNGEYWGCQRPGGGHGEGDAMAFGPICNAKLSDPRYCKKPTDMTYKGSPDERALSLARLVTVKKTTTFEELP